MNGSELPPGFSRETTIRRDRRGRWFHDGEPVVHPKVRRAFDRWIDRADDGRYILKNDANWAYVEIEGAPVFVHRVEERLEDSSFVLHLSDGRSELLDPTTLRQDRDGQLYCDSRSGRMPAAFTVRALVDLSDRLRETDSGVELVEPSGARAWPLPAVDDPLRDGRG